MVKGVTSTRFWKIRTSGIERQRRSSDSCWSTRTSSALWVTSSAPKTRPQAEPVDRPQCPVLFFGRNAGLELDAAAALSGAIDHELADSEIFGRDPDRFEDDDVLIACAATNLARDDIRQLVHLEPIE